MLVVSNGSCKLMDSADILQPGAMISADGRARWGIKYEDTAAKARVDHEEHAAYPQSILIQTPIALAALLS